MRGFCIHTKRDRGLLLMSVWMEGKRWPAPLSILLPHSHCPRLQPYTYRYRRDSRVILREWGCVACGGQWAVWPGMRNGGLPSVALLPPPTRKPHPSVHDLASRLQPSCPPPPPHTQQGKGGDHAVKDAGTRLPSRTPAGPSPMHGKKEAIMAASSSRPPNSLTLATTHHPPPLHSTDSMSSKRGRGGTTGAKFRMTLGLPVAAVINCAGKWVLGGGWWRRG